MDVQEYISLLEAQDGYKDLYRKIENAGFEHFIDECVDRENVYPLTEKNGAVFWDRMTVAMANSVGSRLEEVGYKPNDYGIPY